MNGGSKEPTLPQHPAPTWLPAVRGFPGEEPFVAGIPGLRLHSERDGQLVLRMWDGHNRVPVPLADPRPADLGDALTRRLAVLITSGTLRIGGILTDPIGIVTQIGGRGGRRPLGPASHPARRHPLRAPALPSPAPWGPMRLPPPGRRQ
ncbi:hypothetical protein [Streptomyces ehimensis]|uniref:Uncharacterized protein n=1 Tax=Streptomyces ehimensis TaxID=68195 RepID=A0ABV9BRR8_9ACTN